jgi:signal transduction histidine kinase/ligand-binding sensor domain-containing protein
MRSWTFWLALACAISAQGQGQFRLYTTDDGLPNNSILAILQARDGYLWFTTYRGLVRFDGLHFQVFDNSNTPAIHGTNFVAYSMLEARDGSIWTSAWSAGATRYHNGKFTSYTKRDGLPNNTVTRVDQDDQGNIWFFTSRGLSKLRDDGKIEAVNEIDGERLDPYLKRPEALGGDSHLLGLFRVRVHNGQLRLQRFARGKWSSIPLPPDLPADPAKLRMEITYEDHRGRIWYTIADRPSQSFCAENGRLTIYKGLPAGSYANYLDRLGRLWITDQNGRTAFWKDGIATPMAGVSTATPMRVLEDSEGSYWAGTLNQGLVHEPVQVVSGVRLPGGPEVNKIQPLMQARNGDIWVGSYGLTRIRNGRFETFALPRSMAPWPGDQSVWGLWEDPDGTIFFSNNNGPKIFRNGRIELPGPPFDQIKNRVNAYLRDREGTLWMGNSDGVYVVRGSKMSLLRTESGVPLRGEVRTIYEDRGGTVWIGTDALLCKEQNAGLACFGSTDELAPWRVRGILQDSDGVLWVTTSGKGLLRVEGSQFQWIKAKDGLYTDDGSGILEDKNGYFWIGSRLGIYRVKRQDLNSFVKGEIPRVTTSYFGRKDGLNSVDTIGSGQPKALVAKDGMFWFPTSDGLARINPDLTRFNLAPPRVQIESCSLDQRPIDCGSGESISLPAGARNLEVHYTSLNLVRSDHIQFRYRLDGLDPDWVDVGSRRTAYYPHLPHGTFRLQILGANSFGEWSTQPKELTVIVEPRYFETNWFRALVVAFIGGVFALMWRLRGLQYKLRQQRQRAFAQQIIASQEAERQRIAGELHDSLGQHLTLIKNMALLLSRPNGKNKEQQIEAIATETTQAIAEVRQISRNLRPYQLDLLGLTKAIDLMVNGACEGAGIHPEVQLDDLAGAFPKETEIHLYRIVQECVNNAIKHASASVITLTAQRSGSRVTLIIRDDGVGFTPDRAQRQYSATGGFGLTGISERALLLSGTASFRSAPGQGTTVTIEMQAAAPAAPMELQQETANG